MANFLEELAQGQYGWSKEQMDWAKEDRAKRDLYTQPAVDFYQRLTSGDPRAMGLALAPIKQQTAAGYKTARENVYGTTPRGAGQEFALAQLPIQAATAEAAGTYGAVSGGYEKLANIGSGYGNYALAETGAAATFSGLAGQSEADRLKIEALKRGQTLGFLGDLAKMIGGGGFLSAIGKGLGKLFGGGKPSGAGPTSTPPSGGGTSPSGEPMGNFNWVPSPYNQGQQGWAESSVSFGGPFARNNPNPTQFWPRGTMNKYGVNPEYTDPEPYNPMAGWAGDPGYPDGWWVPVSQGYSPSGEPMP